MGFKSRKPQEVKVRRLASLLCVDWVSGQTRLDKRDGRWWLTGCPEGDHPLPNTYGCHTVGAALESAVAWIAQAEDENHED